jgi:ribokinase
MDFIGCGALNLDRLYMVQSMAEKDEEVPIKESQEQPGGSAANTIYALAKLKHKTGFIGALGDDNNGKVVLSSLENVGVDTSNIQIRPETKTGLVIGIVDEMGERSLFIAPGANNYLIYEDLDMDSVISGGFLHLTSFVNDAQLDTQEKIVKAMMDTTQLSFAPGSLYVKRGFEVLSPIINRTHVIFLNEIEAKVLTGEESYERASEFLIENGCQIVAITLGKKGCFISNGEEFFSLESIKTDAVDTTGAGDAFSAGFLSGLIQDRGLRECGIMGNFLASKCISKIGARSGLPRKEELEKELVNFL